MQSLRVLLALALALPAFAAERGFPLIDLHPQKVHRGGSQTFSVTQGSDGMLYFGTLAGVTTYDGAWWRTLELPNEPAVFALAAGRGPEIAVGSVDEFGWLLPSADGTLAYHSLLPQLPAAQREVGDVRGVCTTATGFLFAAENALIDWSGGAPRLVADLRAKPGFMPRCFRAGNETYVALSDGLHRYDARAKSLERAGFEGKQVELVLPYDELRPLVAVHGEGLFLGNAPFASDAKTWLAGKNVTAGCRLTDGRIVIGTRQDGILILDRNGAIEQRLDPAAGLPDSVLSSALVDREGSLWLTYFGPIARVDLHSAVSLIDVRMGLRGSPMSVARHRDRLYIASSHGLFSTDGTSAIQPVPGTSGTVWHAVSVDDDLLAGTRDGVLLLHGDGPRQSIDGAPQAIDGTKNLPIYDLLRSQKDRDRVWLGTRRGLASVRRERGTWRFEGFAPGSPQHVHSLLEQGDDLWIGTTFSGFQKFANGKFTRFSSGETSVSRIGGAVAGTQPGKVLRPLANGDVASLHELESLVGAGSHVEEDSHGNIWSAAVPPRVIRRLPNGHFDQPLILGAVDASRISRLVPDGDVMWLLTPECLYRYDGSMPPIASRQPQPLIRGAVTSDGAVVRAPLRHAFGRLHIEFAPASYRPGVVYQYRLDPVDAAWSSWSAQPSIDYTNLDAGDYTFRVRARGAAGQRSDETEWTFSVLPPWYRTRWAIALWLFVAALLVALIVRLRTRALQRQAERLRLLVAERTEELQAANAHLERLSLLDELTGIANRRYFQRALVEDWRTAREQRQELALILLDLDHFKLLNDRYGHPAGDAALVQVGRYLARQVRRSGELGARVNDLVARIGGEEFAVLLMQTDEDEALRVAESLRGGIEQLPIDIPSGIVSITASCGVAAVIPLEGEGWTELMRDADRALYAAKAAGRNRVHAATDVEPTKRAAAD